jgi:hypothetical protein
VGIKDRDWHRDLWKEKRANEDSKYQLFLDEGVLPAVQRS